MTSPETSKQELTPLQQRVFAAFQEVGTVNGTAKKLGLSRSTVRSYVASIHAKGHGLLAAVPVPRDMHFTNTTVQYGRDGVVITEWRRLARDKHALSEFVRELRGQADGCLKVPKRRPRKTDTENYLLELPIADAHIGMYAWGAETGESDYDIQRATDTVIGAANAIAQRAAPFRPKHAVVVLVGDQIHSDSRLGKTEKSGNVLDMDTRYQKVLSHARIAMEETVRIAAEVAETVSVQVIPGNHDWHSSWALANILDAAYSRAPNVTVDLSPRPRRCMQWGECFLGWAHGDNVAPVKWASLIPTEFPLQWGATTHRYWHMGHIHHKKGFYGPYVECHSGITIEYLRALCPSDAWHAENGFIGPIPGAEGFLYHRKFGLDSHWYFNSENLLEA